MQPSAIDDVPAILLVDIDAFFAQAEQVRRPELRGRPVIVGGEVTDRSVVAASSYEARARGIKTAMPISQAVRLCPEATFLRGDFDYYSRLSHAMHETCLRHTPLVEMVSMDECFLDLAGCRRRYRPPRRPLPAPGLASHADDAWPLVAADQLRRDIFSATGLHVTIGAAANRMMAKIASDMAKPRGVFYLRPGYESALLAALPLKVLPGIGPKTAERLARYNLHAVRDLAALSMEELAVTFGSMAEHLYRAARGQGSSEVVAEESLPKSIGRETTFQKDSSDRQYLLATMCQLLQRACRQLRREGLLAGTLSIRIRYSDFETVGRSRSLADATDHDDLFNSMLPGMLEKLYSRRVAIRLVGVTLSRFVQSGRQMQLFDEETYQRRSRLYNSIDSVRTRYGFEALSASRAIELGKDE